jgi:hypothetical protein
VSDPPQANTRTAPGEGLVGVVGILTTATALITTAILLLYALIAFWPDPEASTATVRHLFLGAILVLSPDQEVFIVVLSAGALGGVVHSLRSLYWYVGNRNLVRSWLLFYAAIPLIGAALALFFYLALRGGLLSGQASVSDVNAYGFAALGGLVGLFSSQAIKKLKQVFTTFFAQADEGRDHVEPIR